MEVKAQGTTGSISLPSVAQQGGFAELHIIPCLYSSPTHNPTPKTQWRWQLRHRHVLLSHHPTVQGLIARKSVEFFFSNKESLGDKELRVQQLHEITSIRIKAL
jgi:hypothetical protein